MPAARGAHAVRVAAPVPRGLGPGPAGDLHQRALRPRPAVLGAPPVGGRRGRGGGPRRRGARGARAARCTRCGTRGARRGTRCARGAAGTPGPRGRDDGAGRRRPRGVRCRDARRRPLPHVVRPVDLRVVRGRRGGLAAAVHALPAHREQLGVGGRAAHLAGRGGARVAFAQGGWARARRRGSAGRGAPGRGPHDAVPALRPRRRGPRPHHGVDGARDRAAGCRRRRLGAARADHVLRPRARPAPRGRPAAGNRPVTRDRSAT